MSGADDGPVRPSDGQWMPPDLLAGFKTQWMPPDLLAGFKTQWMPPDLLAGFKTQWMPPDLLAGFQAHVERLRETLRRRALPSNLHSLSGVTSDDVLNFTQVHGVSLYLVPRPAVAARLLSASDSPRVRRILGDERGAIIADCREVFARCDSVETMHLRQFAEQAADALEADLFGASQALSASLLDVLNQRHLPRIWGGPVKRGKAAPTVEDALASLAISDPWGTYIVHVVWQAWASYRLSNGDPVPHTFSRHASVHSPGPRQYSRRNAVQALMIVTSTMAYLNGLH
ncbi:hypothetical protein GGG17_02850 [Arsenicicoccus sp. MKL-02]|uniref:Uncharacterized protein n=1 Tax=Arsenicicoccus cauae TaxID=2663847 RepID=A0A6I3IVN4_9MICO|nr:hypothetical protein [Arsenicicoccus cauae]MTB70926.1 hypothetical protein [Arsenicicoccus cauae]